VFAVGLCRKQRPASVMLMRLFVVVIALAVAPIASDFSDGQTDGRQRPRLCIESRGKILINLLKSPIPFKWGKWKSDWEFLSGIGSPPKVNQPQS